MKLGSNNWDNYGNAKRVISPNNTQEDAYELELIEGKDNGSDQIVSVLANTYYIFTGFAKVLDASDFVRFTIKGVTGL